MNQYADKRWTTVIIKKKSEGGKKFLKNNLQTSCAGITIYFLHSHNFIKGFLILQKQLKKQGKVFADEFFTSRGTTLIIVKIKLWKFLCQRQWKISRNHNYISEKEREYLSFWFLKERITCVDLSFRREKFKAQIHNSTEQSQKQSAKMQIFSVLLQIAVKKETPKLIDVSLFTTLTKLCSLKQAIDG